MMDLDIKKKLIKELDENKLLLEQILKLYFDKRKFFEENENSIQNLTNYKYTLERDYDNFIDRKKKFMKKVASFVSLPIIGITAFFTFYFLNTSDISVLFLFISGFTFISYKIFVDFIETYTYLYDRMFKNNTEFKNIINPLRKVNEELHIYITKRKELTDEIHMIYSEYYNQKDKVKSIEENIEQLDIITIDNVGSLDYKDRETPFVKVKKKN